MRWWRGIVVAVCVGAVLSGCSSRGTSFLDERAELFAELPRTCAEIGATVSGELRLFGASLPDVAGGLVGDDRSSGISGQELRCRQTFDDPVPRIDSAPAGETMAMPSTGPMRRSVVIDLWTSPWPKRADRTTEPLAVPDLPFRAKTVEGPTRPAGVGQDAISWVAVDDNGNVSACTRVQVDNLTITVRTSGADWSGSFPTYDTPGLRSDLRAGAEATASRLAAALPATLPRTTIGVYESLEASSTTPPTPRPVTKFEVWDPCELAGPVAESAGLPASPTTIDRPAPDRCYWRTDWGSIQVDSATGVFEYEVYRNNRYAEPRRVRLGDRTAVRVHWESRSPYFCVLAFDTPFGVIADQVAGYVTV